MTHKGWRVFKPQQLKKKQRKIKETNNKNKTKQHSKNKMLIQVIVATKWEQIQQLTRIVFFFWKLAVIPDFILFIYLKALRSVRLNVCLYVLSVLHTLTTAPVPVLLKWYSPQLSQYQSYW